MTREHPIEGLMLTTMNSIQDMVDVNTIIGEPIETSNNVVIIPISKVSFGFAAGGSEFNEETIDEYIKKEKEEQVQYKLPFGGGTGAGVSINPVAFLVIQEGSVKLLPVNHSSAIDRLLDYVPDLFEKANEMMKKNANLKKEIENKVTEKVDKEIKKQEKEKSKKEKKELFMNLNMMKLMTKTKMKTRKMTNEKSGYNFNFISYLPNWMRQ